MSDTSCSRKILKEKARSLYSRMLAAFKKTVCRQPYEIFFENKLTDLNGCDYQHFMSFVKRRLLLSSLSFYGVVRQYSYSDKYNLKEFELIETAFHVILKLSTSCSRYFALRSTIVELSDDVVADKLNHNNIPFSNKINDFSEELYFTLSYSVSLFRQCCDAIILLERFCKRKQSVTKFAQKISLLEEDLQLDKLQSTADNLLLYHTMYTKRVLRLYKTHTIADAKVFQTHSCT